MSFSSEVKEELSKIGNLANKSSVKAELYGFYCSANVTEEWGLMRFYIES